MSVIEDGMFTQGIIELSHSLDLDRKRTRYTQTLIALEIIVDNRAAQRVATFPPNQQVPAAATI